MKKILSMILLMLVLLSAFAAAEELPADETAAVDISDDSVTAEEAEADAEEPVEEGVVLGFDEGFALRLPEGWLYHTVTEEMAVDGVIYCLSDPTGECQLYIQQWNTDCADVGKLLELVNNTATPLNSGKYEFNGTDFVVYDLDVGDVSCCATLLNGKILNFVFTPQSNADYMATAAQVISTFSVL